MLADLLLHATHPDDELARERERLVERIEMASAQPSVIARRALQERRYGTHPVTREMPRPEEVSAVPAEAVRALQASALRPGGAVLVLVGDLDPADAVRRVSSALADWTGGEAAGLPALPVAVDGARLGLRRQPPRSGEHSLEIAREARLTEAEIERMVAAGMLWAPTLPMAAE